MTLPRHRRCQRRHTNRHRGSLFSAVALFLGAVSAGFARADQQEQCSTEASCTASALWLDQMFSNDGGPESLSLNGAWELSPLLSTVYKDDSRTRGLAPIPTLIVPDEKKSDSTDNNGDSNDHIPPYRSHPQRFDSLLSLLWIARSQPDKHIWMFFQQLFAACLSNTLVGSSH